MTTLIESSIQYSESYEPTDYNDEISYQDASLRKEAIDAEITALGTKIHGFWLNFHLAVKPSNACLSSSVNQAK
jgi:hypothetical protein